LLTGLAVLAMGLAVLVSRRPTPSWRPRLGVVVATVALVLVAGFPLQQFYLTNRYVNTLPDTLVAARTFAWVQSVHHARIALVGFFTIQQYPYYGRDLTNYAQYVQRVAPNGALSPYPDCSDWRRALHAGHYTYLVTTSRPEYSWTLADPQAKLIRTDTIDRQPILAVFHLGDRLDMTGCGKSTPLT
jgi:hypothetical protein